MNTQWDLTSRRIALVGLIIFFVYVLYLMRPVMPFVVVSGLLAFLLIPVIDFLRFKLRLPKILAVLLSYVFLFFVILLVPIILLPAFIDAFRDINIDIIKLTADMLNFTRATLAQYRSVEFFGIALDLAPIVDPAVEYLDNISLSQLLPSFEQIINSIPSTVEITFGVASSVVGTITSGVLAMFLTLLYAIYMSLGGENYAKTLRSITPEVYRAELGELARRIRYTWRAYFRGQVLLSLSIGGLTWIFGTAIGLPGAFALAVIAGVLEILPGLGPILATIPAVIVALVQGSNTLAVNNLLFSFITLGAYVIIQQLENNLIVPKILGEAVELDPLVVMIGVVVGASTGGILGALLAAPVIATARTVLMYIYAKMLGEDPFPPKEVSHNQPPGTREQLKVMWQSLRARWQALRPPSPPPEAETDNDEPPTQQSGA